MKKGISIIMPCYNRASIIGRSIESILNQQFDGDFEVVVSDDGSKDNSIEIAAGYGDRIKIVEKPSSCKDQGVSGARNRAIAHASYEYIMFLDSDDYYLPGIMKTMFETLESDDNLGFAFCRSKKFILNQDGTSTLTNWTRKKINAIDEQYCVLSRSYAINTNTIIARKSIIDQLGGFDQKLTNGEDGDLWMRMSEISRSRFVDIHGVVYCFDDTIDRLTNNNSSIVERCSMDVSTKALGRYLLSGCNDKIRLYLITKQFVIKYYSKYPFLKKRPKLILLCSLLKLIYLFPITYIRYVIKSGFSVIF